MPLAAAKALLLAPGLRFMGDIFALSLTREFKSFGLKGRPSSHHILHFYPSTKQLLGSAELVLETFSVPSPAAGCRGSVPTCCCALQDHWQPPQIQDAQFRAWYWSRWFWHLHSPRTSLAHPWAGKISGFFLEVFTFCPSQGKMFYSFHM